MSFHSLNRALITLLFPLAAGGAMGQGSFTINGRVKVDGGSLDGVKVVVTKDGQKDRTLSSNLTRFSLELETGHNYVLTFEKDGFVTKRLSFDTHAPAEAVEQGFTPFEFAVSLFKQYDDVNMVIFNQPVGMIRYDASVGDFDYDTDYTKSIQSQLQKVQEEVAEKQKVEADAAVNAEKAKAEEAKAKAKAEEDAKKAAADKAAADAKAKRDAEAAATKAEADRKKQEAAAARAEQEKAAAEAKRLAEEKKAQDSAAKAEADRKAAEARKAEDERRKAELAKAQEKPPPPPPAPAVKKEAPKPPPPPPPQRNALSANAREGEDGRRTAEPTEGSEESRMHDATARTSEEERPEETPVEPISERDEELIIEKNQVITVIRLATDREKAEYRKVVHKYGATFYFKNGEAISKDIYDHEALAETR